MVGQDNRVKAVFAWDDDQKIPFVGIPGLVAFPAAKQWVIEIRAPVSFTR